MSTAGPPAGAPVDLQYGAYAGEEWIVTGTFPATTPSGSVVQCNVSRGAGIGNAVTIQSNFDEIWHVEVFYTYGAVPSPDIQLVPVVNGSNQPTTYLFSSLLQTNYARPGLTYTWQLLRGSTIGFNMVNTAVVGGAPISITFKVKIGRFKVGTR